MDERKVYIIPMPNVLGMYLARYGFFNDENMFKLELTDFIVDTAMSMLSNIDGILDVSEIKTILLNSRMAVTDTIINEVIDIVRIASYEIINILVLHNIHGNMFYVGEVSPYSIKLFGYSYTHTP